MLVFELNIQKIKLLQLSNIPSNTHVFNFFFFFFYTLSRLTFFFLIFCFPCSLFSLRLIWFFFPPQMHNMLKHTLKSQIVMNRKSKASTFYPINFLFLTFVYLLLSIFFFTIYYFYLIYIYIFKKKTLILIRTYKYESNI